MDGARGVSHVAVESFEVEFHLAEVFGLELVNLEVEGDETLQVPVVKTAGRGGNPCRPLAAGIARPRTEVAAQFEQEFLQVRHQAALEVALVMD